MPLKRKRGVSAREDPTGSDTDFKGPAGRLSLVTSAICTRSRARTSPQFEVTSPQPAPSARAGQASQPVAPMPSQGIFYPPRGGKRRKRDPDEDDEDYQEEELPSRWRIARRAARPSKAASVGSVASSSATTSASCYLSARSSSPNTDSEESQPMAENTDIGFDNEHDNANKHVAVMKDIIGQLQSFPTGEIAYGRSLVNAPPLNLMVEGMGNVATPVSVHELRKLIKFARDERIKNAGTDWLSLPRMPTWFISADHVGTDSEEWAVYVKHAAETAGEYLGFGQHSTGITTALQGLYIWEEESLWRNFCKRNESGQIGILLIIFESAYEEGEIAIGYKNKDMFFQPAMAASSLFMIAAHKGVVFDNLPISKGYRLALAYDLHLEAAGSGRKDRFVQKLTTCVTEAQDALQHGIKSWAMKIEQSLVENRPLLFVLEGVYEKYTSLCVDDLCAEDRAKAIALRHIQLRPNNGYKLRLFLVSVTAVSKNYEATAARRIKYSIQQATDLNGLVRPDIRDLLIEQKSIGQPREFAQGGTVRRQVTEAMNTTTKTRTCIMLIIGGRD